MQPETDDILQDANNNTASITYFGSREAAQRALDSLVDCDNCRNCYDCSGCSDCSGCYDCSGCSRCSGCSGCSRCYDCSRCSDCSGCSRCSGCFGCSGCSDCSGCSRCSDCSGCSGCSRCFGCSGRSDCYDCSRCSDCSGCSRCSGCFGKTGDFVPPEIPKIENIHARVAHAVSQSDALNMSIWHTCDTTHCRAGWVVHLAGEAGYALERFHNTALAAQLIYRASSPISVSPVRFFETDAQARADIQRCAEAEAVAA